MQHVWLVQPPSGEGLYLSRAAGKRANDLSHAADVKRRLQERAARGLKMEGVTPGSRRDRRSKKADRAWVEDVALDQAHASLGRGAARFLSVRTFDSSEGCLAALRAVEGLEVWATDLGQGAKVLDRGAPWLADDARLPARVALVVGTESTGVSNAFLEAADERVYLPMNGMQDSLNVAVATALALQSVLNLYGPDACGDLLHDDVPGADDADACLLYTSPSPRAGLLSRMPSSA